MIDGVVIAEQIAWAFYWDLAIKIIEKVWSKEVKTKLMQCSSFNLR